MADSNEGVQKAIERLSGDIDALKKVSAERAQVAVPAITERLAADLDALREHASTIKADAAKMVDAVRSEFVEQLQGVKDDLAAVKDLARTFGQANAILKGKLRSKGGE